MTWQPERKRSEPRRKLTPTEEAKRAQEQRAWAGRSRSLERRYLSNPADFEQAKQSEDE